MRLLGLGLGNLDRVFAPSIGSQANLIRALIDRRQSLPNGYQMFLHIRFLLASRTRRKVREVYQLQRSNRQW
jgi:hypothetical protein